MPKRILTGTIVSDKADKTIVVSVERRVKHPLYGKIIKRSKKYHAHDESNAFKEGEIVRIEETRPMSKLKTWTVLGYVEGKAAADKADAKKPAKAKKAKEEAPETEAAEAETAEA
jgi:small subunit ribosomal protein S17